MTFITCKHQKYLQATLENEDEFSYSCLYGPFQQNNRPKCKGDPGWRWRYRSLLQDTRFFKNIVFLQNLRFKCKNEDMWYVELDLHCIQQEVADFEIAYCWMNPLRWHSYDWRCFEHFTSIPFPLSTKKNEYLKWNFVRSRFKNISNMHLPICSVDDFINYGICV